MHHFDCKERARYALLRRPTLVQAHERDISELPRAGCTCWDDLLGFLVVLQHQALNYEISLSVRMELLPERRY